MAAVVASLLGLLLYLNASDSVVVVVDGEATTLQTDEATVREALAGAGIRVGPHDEVAPDLHAPIVDGMRIKVLTAKEITLVMNGRPRTLNVPGETVEDVLEYINLRRGRHDYLSTSRGKELEEGDVIVYREAVGVRVHVDGGSKRIITNAENVGALLDSLGIILRRRDFVTPGIDAAVAAGMDIRVVRVEVQKLEGEEAIPFETEIRYSKSMLRGERRVEREGENGLERHLYRVRLENGVEVGRELLRRWVERRPVNRVEVVGTRDPNVQEGIASWYDADGSPGACGMGLTGAYAAHRTLPCGTSVRVIDRGSGRSVTVVVKDRGPFVGGRIIDLSDEAFSQLAPLSNGTINVRITW